MVWKLIGKGSQYAWGYLDRKGGYLDAGMSYKLNLPGNVPAEKFMSVVIYDSQTSLDVANRSTLSEQEQ